MRDLSREPDKSMLGLQRGQQELHMMSRCCGHSLLERGGQAGNPAGVALEGAAEDELLSHCDVVWRGRCAEFWGVVVLEVHSKVSMIAKLEWEDRRQDLS